MSEIRIPTVVAVTAWIASALAVASYTYIAFKETASDLEAMGMTVTTGGGLLAASAEVIAADSVTSKPQKPLNREKFKPSR